MVQKQNFSDFLTHRQIDKGKNVVLDQDGEAQEDGIQQEHINTQLFVQLPPVHMDPQNLCRKKGLSLDK